MSDTFHPGDLSAKGGLRGAIIDLVSRREAAEHTGGLYAEESDLLAALQALISGGGDRERISSGYRAEMRDSMARIFADFDF